MGTTGTTGTTPEAWSTTLSLIQSFSPAICVPWTKVLVRNDQVPAKSVAYEMIVVWVLWVLCIFPLSCTPFLTDPALKTHGLNHAVGNWACPLFDWSSCDRETHGPKSHWDRTEASQRATSSDSVKRGCTLSIVSLVRGFLDATWCPYNFKNEAKSGFFGFQLTMEGTLTWSEMSHL